MAAKLGATDVSFRLGSATPAKVALGSVEIWAASRTLYWGGGSNDWSALSNWWNDAGLTSQATALPEPGDSVYAQNAEGFALSANSGDAPTVANLTSSRDLSISITVTGEAVFSGGSVMAGTITGNVVFNGSATHIGTINGNATFNDSASNYGTVTGTVTCNTTGNCTAT